MPETEQQSSSASDTLAFLEKEFLLPNELEIEREVIGLMTRDVNLRLQALSIFKEDDFFAEAYKEAFRAILILTEKSEDISALSISEVMKSRASLELIGGYKGIVSITQTETKTVKSLHTLSKVLRDKAVKRDVFRVCKAVAAECLSADSDSLAVLKSYEAHLSRINSTAQTVSTVKTMKEVSHETRIELERWKSGSQTALKTGIPEWDRYLVYGGFSQGDLIYIAARSSYGKTAIAWQIMRNMARNGHAVLFFSAEMEAMKLMLRAMQGQASKYTTDHRGLQFTPHLMRFDKERDIMFELATRLLAELEELPIYIDDTTRSWYGMKAKAREYKERFNIQAIWGDYIQLGEIDLGRNSTRAHEVGKISTESKSLAKELELPFCWLSQVNRANAKDNREPELHDLKESGQQEQDADVVIFLYGDGPTEDERRQVKSKFSKQRNGPVGKRFDMDFETDKQLFVTEGLLELMAIESTFEENQKREPERESESTTEAQQAGVKLDEIDDIPF